MVAVAAAMLLGAALPAMAQSVFCLTAVDLLPPPGDATNPVPEIRVIELSLAETSPVAFAASGAVVGGNRGRFLFSGTVRLEGPNTVEIGLTGVAAAPAASLAAYRALMQFSLLSGAGLYNDNLAPAPFGTDQMTVTAAAGPCP
jgi:hypothetical protein